jgi:hypothetical protein
VAKIRKNILFQSEEAYNSNIKAFAGKFGLTMGDFILNLQQFALFLSGNEKNFTENFRQWKKISPPTTVNYRCVAVESSFEVLLFRLLREIAIEEKTSLARKMISLLEKKYSPPLHPITIRQFEALKEAVTCFDEFVRSKPFWLTDLEEADFTLQEMKGLLDVLNVI